MMARHDYDRRLTSLERQLGCPVHGTPLVCAVCDVEDDLTEDGWAELEILLDKLDLLEDPALTGRPCSRCGADRMCQRCNALEAARVPWSRLDALERERCAVLLSQFRLKCPWASH
jgi:hypothetical protein